MKHYELKFKEGSAFVFRVSAVESPAVEETLQYFSKEKVQFFADEEKQIFYSVVMRPNKVIPRNSVNGEPATVSFSKETVEQAQINYFRNNGNASTNINHDKFNAEGIFPFESWIVKDAKTDRGSVDFGLNVIDGDWVMGFKVDNKELWNDHIKTGKINGLSVEVKDINYELKEDIEMSKQEEKQETGIVERLKKGIEAVFSKAENFEEETEKVKAPQGEHELKDGTKIFIGEDGIAYIVSTPESSEEDMSKDDEEKKEDMSEDNKEDEEKLEEEETSPEDVEVSAEVVASLKKDLEDLKTEVRDLKAEKEEKEAELETMSKEKKDLEDKVQEMAKQTPAAEPIKDLPKPQEAKSYDEMSNFEKLQFNKEHKRQY